MQGTGLGNASHRGAIILGERVSIIEKAVSRLGQGKPGISPKPDMPGTVPATRNADTPPSLVDRAVQSHASATAAGIAEQRPDSTLAEDPRPLVPGQTQGAGITPVIDETPVPPRIIKRVEINLDRLAANNMVTSDGGRNPVAEEFRAIKRPLIDNAFSKDGRPVNRNNLIMVTSALPGEGKTFSAVNLAMSLAMELDRTVLLVDADVARPSLPALLGLPSSRGLLDVLESSNVNLSHVLLRTNIDKLSILPSGTPHSHATELLTSGMMTKLLEEMAVRYSDRIIVFDSPPLLVTTEARVLATQMGQVVFVVHAESTLQSDVKRALATIESCPIKMMVLNQARTVSQGAHGYGYGYGYGA